MTRLLKPFLALALCFWAFSGLADERILIKAYVNGKPVHFAFDTGSSYTLLTQKTVDRLKLKTTNAPADFIPPPGMAISQTTERCKLTIFKNHIETTIPIFDLPPYVKLDVDGLIGWTWVAQNVFQIDADSHWVTFYNEVPGKTRNWLKFPLETNSYILQFELRDKDGGTAIVNVDTGSPSGVSLSPARWADWKSGHSNDAVTLKAVYRPDSGGVVVSKEAWARELSIGPLTLAGVPIEEAAPVDVALGESRFAATFGLAALKRMDFIMDGKKGFVYLRPKTEQPDSYNYNRMGAVFVPQDGRGDDLVAVVLNGSPAYEAGIHQGDALLRINEVDIATLRKDPKVHFSDFWQRPARTKLDLTLKRDNKEFKTTVQLRDILTETVK